jgi:DNA-binding MarR family transcriptional regulator
MATKAKPIKPIAKTNDEDYNLWVMLRQTRDAMAKARERELGKHGISSIQGSVLHNIQSIGPDTTPAEIARHLVREPHSVSGLLSRMEKQGLIKRVKDLPRRNMIRVVMTKKGEEAYKFITQRTTMHDVMSVLTKQEKKVMWDILLKLRGNSLKLAGITHDVPFPDGRIK